MRDPWTGAKAVLELGAGKPTWLSAAGESIQVFGGRRSGEMAILSRGDELLVVRGMNVRA